MPSTEMCWNKKSTTHYGCQKCSPESCCTGCAIRMYVYVYVYVHVGCANSTTSDLSDVIEVDDTPGARCARRMKGHSFPNCLKSPFRRKYLL